MSSANRLEVAGVRGRARFTAQVAVCATTLLVAGAATAQNLVTNGDFDTSIDDWTPAATATFVGDDWLSDPSSGSLRLVNDDVNPTAVLVSQCVPLGGADPVIFEGAFRGALSGEAATGRLRIGASWHSQTDCSPESALVPYLFAVTVDAPIDWTLATSIPETPPEGSVAVAVQLIAFKTSAGGSLTADFDAIYVPEPGTTAAGALGAAALMALRRHRRGATG